MSGPSAKLHDRYTPVEIDRIARVGGETVVAAPGVTVEYDVEAYERIARRQFRVGTHRIYQPFRRARKPARLATRVPKGCIDRRGYLIRLGGFRRNDIFGPDECGASLRKAGIRYADSLGNGLFEHLLLCRKYGIAPTFESPALGIPLPFLPEEMLAFESLYRQQVTEMRRWVTRIETIYGHRILEQQGQPWIVWLRLSPLALFMMSAARKPRETADALEQASGVRRLGANPQTPRGRAAQARAWAFIRRQHMRVHQIMADVTRELVARRGVIVGNLHTLPQVDYELMGQVFDYPGVAVRASYMRERSCREPYIGYAVRLFNDLSGRAPIVSLRVNITAAGSREVCSSRAVRAWHDEAVRHGAAGFYVWPIDYPNGPGQYCGPMPGNPDRSACGRERWDAMLQACRDVSACRRFVPPESDVCVLVASDVLSQADWKRVMCACIELEEARIWYRMVSARAVERDVNALKKCRLLVIPALPFASDSLISSIERYLRAGGRVATPSRDLAMHDLDGAPRAGPFLDSTQVIVMPTPACGRVLDSRNVAMALAKAARTWRAVAKRARVQDRSWVFDIACDTLMSATGKVETGGRPEGEPDLRLGHYLYEHSSNWILPYIDNPTSSPDGGER